MGGLVVLVAVAALALAACSSGPSAPQVASLGQHSGHDSGTTTTTPSAGDPTRLLDEWTNCIRSNGDPNQADPTIDSNKDIDITMDNVSQTLENEVHGSTGPCSNYLLAAENALRGGQPALQEPSAAQQAKYADCMRTHGVPNYPNPNPATGKTDFNGTGVDLNSPTFNNADKFCTEQAGQKYYPPGTEAPGVVKVTGFNGPPGVKPPSGPPGNSGSGNSGSGRVPAQGSNG
jgi:hypothetical protein